MPHFHSHNCNCGAHTHSKPFTSTLEDDISVENDEDDLSSDDEPGSMHSDSSDERFERAQGILDSDFIASEDEEFEDDEIDETMPSAAEGTMTNWRSEAEEIT